MMLKPAATRVKIHDIMQQRRSPRSFDLGKLQYREGHDEIELRQCQIQRVNMSGGIR